MGFCSLPPALSSSFMVFFLLLQLQLRDRLRFTESLQFHLHAVE